MPQSYIVRRVPIPEMMFARHGSIPSISADLFQDSTRRREQSHHPASYNHHMDKIHRASSTFALPEAARRSSAFLIPVLHSFWTQIISSNHSCTLRSIIGNVRIRTCIELMLLFRLFRSVL